MASRSLLLLGVMFVSLAWSQKSAADESAPSPQSFDLSSDSIKKIVRDMAAAQSQPVRISEETPVEREADSTVKYVPPEEAQPAKSQVPRRPTAPPESDGPISALIDTLVDMALDVDDDSLGYYSVCPPTGALNTPAPSSEDCQLVSR
jgi:hypothetical protein